MVEEIPGYKITSLDGEDNTGHRAEVSVQVGTGKVDRINLSNNGKTAQIEIRSTNPKIKKNPKGWIKVDEPLFDKFKSAEVSGEVIKYRLESQRKSNIDRKIPMADLAQDKDNRSETLRALMVGFNDELTSEAVTDPNEDERFNTHRKFSAVGTYDPQAEQGRESSRPRSPLASSSAKSWRSLTASYGKFLDILSDQGFEILGDEGIENRRVAASLSKDFVDVVNAVVSKSHPDNSGGASDYSVGTRSLAYVLVESVNPVTHEAIISPEGRRAWKNSLYSVLLETVRNFDALTDGAPVVFPNVGSTNEVPDDSKEAQEPEAPTETEADGADSQKPKSKDDVFIIPKGTEISDGEMSGGDEVKALSNLCASSGVAPKDAGSLLRATYGISKVNRIPKSDMATFLTVYSANPELFFEAANTAAAEWEASR